MIQKLEELLLVNDVDVFFTEREKLNRKQQIFDVIDLIKTPVNELAFKAGLSHSDDSYFFRVQDLDSVISSSYPDEASVSKFLFKDIIGVDVQKGLHAFDELYKIGKSVADLSRKDVIISALNSLIYDPTALYISLAKYFPKELSKQLGHPSKVRWEDVESNPQIRDMQYKLIKDLIEKNKPYVTVSRLFPATILCKKKFKEMLPGLTGISKVETEEETRAKMLFGMLTHHVGYMNMPNYGKYEYLFSVHSTINTASLLDGIIRYPTRSDSAVIKDLYLQSRLLSAITLVLGESWVDKDSTISNLRNKLSVAGKEQEQKVALKAEYDAALKKLAEIETSFRTSLNREISFRDDLAKRNESLESENIVLKSKPNDEQLRIRCDNLEAKAKKCTDDRIAQTDHYKKKEGQYQSKISDLSGQLRGLGNKLQEVHKERDELKHQLYLLQHPVQYHVNVDGVMHRYSNGFKKEVDRAVEVLSRDMNKGEVIMKTESRHAYRNLHRTYPAHDNFYKLRTHGWTRVIYTILPGQKVKVLDVMNHEEYNRLCKDNN